MPRASKDGKTGYTCAMKYLLVVTAFFLLLGIGCRGETSMPRQAPIPASPKIDPSPMGVSFPVDRYLERRTFKNYGEYISDRFRGYHAGEDVEYADITEDVPVRAIHDGTIRLKEHVSGYGGLVIVEHVIEGLTYHALYGHIDLTTSPFKVGDAVKRGDTLGMLGDDRSAQTDGERKHLHFALYQADSSSRIRVAGYAQTPTELATWLNPTDFFIDHGLAEDPPGRMWDSDREVGGTEFKLRFPVPRGFEVEYIPSIKALNVYRLAGTGTARERSHLLIRFFDSSRFETLTTVTIHETRDLTLEPTGYTARQYDIEKKAGVANFVEQPAWRNARHVVTDFRDKEGQTRYYVVAASPSLDKDVYDAFLSSIEIMIAP